MASSRELGTTASGPDMSDDRPTVDEARRSARRASLHISNHPSDEDLSLGTPESRCGAPVIFQEVVHSI